VDRAEELIRALGLVPHPEGGHYRETYRSASRLPGGRAACTHIHFLLRAGERSRWHRVDADELWQLVEGGPLELFRTDGDRVVRSLLEAPGGTAAVPAGAWQAARPTADYALVGCTVAPAFEFRGFALLADDPSTSERFRREHPALADLI
jgi:predicted cupin superfamily sugar epimerase